MLLSYFLLLRVCYILILHKDIILSVDDSKHDKEGRVITAEYEKFYLVAACKFIPRCSRGFCALSFNLANWVIDCVGDNTIFVDSETANWH